MSVKLISSVAAAALLASGGFAVAQGTGAQRDGGAGGTASVHGSQSAQGGERSGGTKQSAAGARDTGKQARDTDHDGSGAGKRDATSAKAERDGGGNDRHADRDRTGARADRDARGDTDHDGKRADRGNKDRDARNDRGDKSRDRDARNDRGDRVNLNIRVGGIVPRDRSLNRVDTTIITRYPQYRNYRQIVADNQILIIDPSTRKIVRTLDETEGRSVGMDHRAKDCR